MNRHNVRGAALAVLLSVASLQPVQAQVSAYQCNFLRNGTYVPGLRVIIDGRVFEVVIGQRGLRSSNLYRADKVEAYTRRAFWLGNRQISVTLGCGLPPDEEIRKKVVPVIIVPFDDSDGEGDPEVENEEESEDRPGDNDGRDQER